MRSFLAGVVGVGLVVSSWTAAEAATPKFSVTLTTSKTVVDHGSSLRLSGKVAPAAKGQKVYLQRRVGTSTTWRTFATRTLSSKSTYAATTTPSPGPVKYRVTKAKKGKRAGGVSPTRTVAVMRWRNLVGKTPVAASGATFGTFNAGFLSVSAPMFQSHPSSVSLADNGLVTWDVTTWSCTAFRASVGVRDTASNAARFFAYPFFSRDGFSVGYAELDFSRYQSVRAVSHPLVGGDYDYNGTVTLQAYRTDGGAADPTAQLVYGTPKVYCNS